MGNLSVRKKTIKQIIFWTIIVGAIVALFVPVFTHAQPANVCEVFGNCTAGIDQYSSGGSNNIAKFILSIAYVAVYVAGAIAVLFIVLGGYSMITSGGDSNKYKKGQETLSSAVIGLVVVIVSFTIVTVIGNVLSSADISSTPSSGSSSNSGLSNSPALK